jgi:hypothetical protein
MNASNFEVNQTFALDERNGKILYLHMHVILLNQEKRLLFGIFVVKL